MKKFAFIPLLALAFTAACDARQEVQPTEGAAIAGPSFSASSEGSVSTAGRSTVCIAYDNERARLEADLAANPGNAAVEADLVSIKEVITDSCPAN